MRAKQATGNPNVHWYKKYGHVQTQIIRQKKKKKTQIALTRTKYDPTQFYWTRSITRLEAQSKAYVHCTSVVPIRVLKQCHCYLWHALSISISQLHRLNTFLQSLRIFHSQVLLQLELLLWNSHHFLKGCWEMGTGFLTETDFMQNLLTQNPMPTSHPPRFPRKMVQFPIVVATHQPVFCPFFVLCSSSSL